MQIEKIRKHKIGRSIEWNKMYKIVGNEEFEIDKDRVNLEIQGLKLIWIGRDPRIVEIIKLEEII